jgi:putative flippase GtrA
MKVRWLTFTAVGVIGFVVQLAALWILKNQLGLHYLSATLVATELAILLNFFCHEWWTWSDRPADTREAIGRLFRFHIANGSISLAGGALIMPLIVEFARVHYLLANVLTVGLCSVANFVAADRVVFRTGTDLLNTIRLKPDPTTRLIRLKPDPTGSVPTRSMPVLLLMVALFAWSAPVAAAELRADTIDAFNRYVRVTESRMDGELQGKVPFLWVDRLPEADRWEAYARLKRGDTVVERLVTRDRGREIDCPHGLIHHWIGTTFAPNATADRAVALMQDYDRYQEIYSPNVRRSHTISRQGESFKFYLQLFMKKVISVVLNTEYDVRYTRISPARVSVRSYSTRIAEVRDPGSADEKEAPVGQDSGYLWRFYNYCSLEERAEGTYIQCESVSLSRGIPTGLGWLVGPFVTSIPRESLEFSLGSQRKALSYSGK